MTTSIEAKIERLNRERRFQQELRETAANLMDSCEARVCTEGDILIKELNEFVGAVTALLLDDEEWRRDDI